MEIIKDVATDISQTIGSTPMVKLNRVGRGYKAKVLLKLEYFNPSGSVKDRIVFNMIEAAEAAGQLKPGMTIIEGSSGNTGISLALAGAVKGYDTIVVMPENMSAERKKTICAYGAKLVLTPGGSSNIDLVVDKVKEIISQDPENCFCLNQFENQQNPYSHYQGTAREIWEQAGKSVDIFVGAQGTGGTVTGVSRFLKEQNNNTMVFTVEPKESPVIAGGEKGEHPLEGIGDGFIPGVLDLKLLDGVVHVSSPSAVKMAKRLAREEGIFCGLSSGCNVTAALMLARKYPEARNIVTTINDNGLRYFSTELCQEDKAADLLIPELEKEPVATRLKSGLILIS